MALSRLKRVYNAHIELVEQLEAAGQVLLSARKSPRGGSVRHVAIDHSKPSMRRDMPAPNAFSHNRKLSVFSPENKVVVFPVNTTTSRETRLVFFDFAPLFVKTYGEGGAKFFCLD